MNSDSLGKVIGGGGGNLVKKRSAVFSSGIKN